MILDVKNKGLASRHTGTKIRPHGSEYYDSPVRHVLAAVCPHPFNDRLGSRVSHSKALSGPPSCKQSPSSCSIQHRVAAYHAVLMSLWYVCGWCEHDTATVHTLGHIVVCFPSQDQAHTTITECAEALPGDTMEMQIDGSVRQALLAQPPRNLATEPGTYGTGAILDLKMQS